MAVHFTIGEVAHEYPLFFPRIGWRKISGTISSSTAAAGYAAANAATYRTDSFWRPTAATGWFNIIASSPEEVTYCGIAAHDLATQNATVVVEYYDGTVWVQVGPTVTPEDNGAILILFTKITAASWRLRITAADAAPTMAVIQFGRVTEFPRPAVYAPSVSFERARQVTYAVNITNGGHYSGRSVERISLQPVMKVNYISEEWIAAEWDDFVAHAEVNPFFIADRPETHPKSVAYAWTNSQLIPDRATPNKKISNNIELQLTGFME